MTHYMKLHPAPFSMIKSGQKTIELRLFDEKRQILQLGDTIVFSQAGLPGETLAATVVGLHKFPSFAALYSALPLLQCGYTPEDIGSADPSDMDAYYPPEEQRQYGVIGIELSLE